MSLVAVSRGEGGCSQIEGSGAESCEDRGQDEVWVLGAGQWVVSGVFGVGLNEFVCVGGAVLLRRPGRSGSR